MLLRYGFLLILWKSKMCSIEVPETGELPHSPLASQCRISLPWYLVHVLDRWWCVYLWFLSILSYTESLFRLKNIYKSILYLNPVHYLLLCLSRLLVVCYKFQCFNILCKAVFVKKKRICWMTTCILRKCIRCSWEWMCVSTERFHHHHRFKVIFHSP